MYIQVIIALLLIINTETIAGSTSRCASYPDPKNGYITCDSLFHLFCSPECHPGYRFAAKPAVVYMCGPVTGEWFTYPVGIALPWPDCVPEERSDNIIHEELAKKREEITKYIADSHTGIPSPHYSQARSQDPEERYHHLYDYIERAQKAYEYREAIEKEAEKLKHKNVENKSDDHIGSSKNNAGTFQPSSIASKTTIPYANNLDSRKETASANGRGIPKGFLEQTMLARKEQIPRYDQRSKYINHQAPTSNNIPKIIEKGNGLSAAQRKNTNLSSANSSPLNSQVQNNVNSQMNKARLIETGTGKKGERTSHFKQDSNFVLKMLNNEEFKDLHYLDEHVRLNRNAPTSSAIRNSKQRKMSVLQKDKRIGTNRDLNNRHLEFESSREKHLRSGDNSTTKTTKGITESASLSSHIVPIVMQGKSLVGSIYSLLRKNEVRNTNTTEKKKILNPQDQEWQKQQTKTRQPKNNISVYTQELSLRKNDVFSIDKSQVPPNQDRQNNLESSDVKNNHMIMKQLYNSWLKRKFNSVNLNFNERKKEIYLRTKPFPETQVNTVVAQKENSEPMKNTIQGGKLFQEKEERMKMNSQSPREHLFYFPIKKKNLFQILNQTNVLPKS